MSEIAELEQRITAALARIGQGLDTLSRGAVAKAASTDDKTVPPTSSQTDLIAEIADLRAEVTKAREALATERDANSQLTERVRAIKDRQESMVGGLERKVEKLTEQLDVVGLELQRTRKTNIALRESLRAMRRTVEEGVPDPHLINKSMMAELDALRASRLTEIAEMDAILAELKPLIDEAANA